MFSEPRMGTFLSAGQNCLSLAWNGQMLMPDVLQVISWIAPCVSWSKALGNKFNIIRDQYDQAIITASQDCLLVKKPGLKRKVRTFGL
jgi:hypothetical protein